MRSLATLVSLACIGAAVAQQNVAELVAKLRAAPGQTDRIALLTDEQFVFDFLKPPSGIAQGSAGRTVTANSGNFPAVIGNGVAMTIGFLDACGINTPHTHPRATEINFAVNGTFRTGILAENGARFIFGDVPPGSASVFPKGAIHFEQNNECTPNMFVAAFNDEDPGVLAVAQRYFGLPPDIIGATLNGLGVEQVAGLEAKIPNNIALGTDDCLKRCGITRPPTQLTSQRQPRVKGNALPQGFAGPDPAPGASHGRREAVPEAEPAPQPEAQPIEKRTSYLVDSEYVSMVYNASPLVTLLVGMNIALAVFILGGLFYIIKNRQPKQAVYMDTKEEGRLYRDNYSTANLQQ